MVKRNTKNWFRHGTWWKRLHRNHRYRDVLFRYLFQEKENLLDLYNALNGSTYQNPEDLEVVTMEDVIFMKMKNDLSYNLILNLSDSFSAGRGNGCLECTCEILNINRGFNQALMEKCHRLWEYSEFSSEIEENIKSGMCREEAIHTAIDTCIEKGILKDILIRQKAEVLHMLLTEYDEKKHFRTLFREGIRQGREDLLRELVQKKLAKGKTIPEIASDLEEDTTVIEQLISSCHLEH